MGRDGVEGITSDTLRAAQSGDRIPLGKRFSAPVKIGPETNPPSYTMGSGSLLGGKVVGKWCWLPTPSNTGIKERVEWYIYCTSGPSLLLLGSTYSYLYLLQWSVTFCKYNTPSLEMCYCNYTHFPFSFRVTKTPRFSSYLYFHHHI